MPTPKQQRRRALELLEASIDGCTEAIMLAYGFKTELLGAAPALRKIGIWIDFAREPGGSRTRMIRITSNQPPEEEGNSSSPSSHRPKGNSSEDLYGTLNEEPTSHSLSRAYFHSSTRAPVMGSYIILGATGEIMRLN
jgi:hypothetical protein